MNYVEHNNVYIMGPIAARGKTSFYRQIENLAQQMSDLAPKWKEVDGGGHAATINIFLSYLEEKKCEKQATDLVDIIETATESGVHINMTVVADIGEWAGWMFIKNTAWGSRTMYEDAGIWYENSSKDPETSKWVKGQKRMSALECLKIGFCDKVLMNNGKVLFRSR